MNRRKSRSGGGSTNRSNDATLDVPTDTLSVPRTKSLPLRPVSEHGDPERDPERPMHTPPRTLGESFQESTTHNSWRGFPRKAKTGKSSGPG